MTDINRQLPDGTVAYTIKHEIVTEEGQDSYLGFPLPSDDLEPWEGSSEQPLRMYERQEFPFCVVQRGVQAIFTNRQVRIANILAIDATGVPLFMHWADIKPALMAHRTDNEVQRDARRQGIAQAYQRMRLEDSRRDDEPAIHSIERQLVRRLRQTRRPVTRGD